ncbi:MAG: hypothetical protein WBW88_20355 [Rhodothermales bacterium]
MMISATVRAEKVKSANEPRPVCGMDELDLFIGLQLSHFGCHDLGGGLHPSTSEEVRKFWLGYRIMCGIIVVLFAIEIIVLAL